MFTVGELVMYKIHKFFLEKYYWDIDLKEEEDTPTEKFFDILDLIEIEMEMNKYYGLAMDNEAEKWERGTIKDIVDSIVTKLKEEGL